MFPAKFARMFLILRVGIKAARNVLQVEKKVKFEPWATLAIVSEVLATLPIVLLLVPILALVPIVVANLAVVLELLATTRNTHYRVSLQLLATLAIVSELLIFFFFLYHIYIAPFSYSRCAFKGALQFFPDHWVISRPLTSWRSMQPRHIGLFPSQVPIYTPGWRGADVG